MGPRLRGDDIIYLASTSLRSPPLPLKGRLKTSRHVLVENLHRAIEIDRHQLRHARVPPW